MPETQENWVRVLTWVVRTMGTDLSNWFSLVYKMLESGISRRLLGLMCDFMVLRLDRTAPPFYFLSSWCHRLAALYFPKLVRGVEGTYAREITSSEGVKMSKTNGSDKPWTNSCRQLRAFDTGRSPTLGGPATPVPGTRTCLPAPRFHRQPDNPGAWHGQPALNALLWKPFMREKAPFFPLLSDTVLWDNIGHYEVSGFTWDSIE